MENGELRAKVGDFGLSRIVPKSRQTKHDSSRMNVLSLFTSNTTSRPSSAKQARLENIRSDDSLRHSGGHMTSARGTVAYMAPELLTKSALNADTDEVQYTTAVDTYAYGMILWEALTLSRAWANMKFSTQVIDIVENGGRCEIPEVYRAPLTQPPKGYVTLLGICWHQRAEARPKFGHVIEALKVINGLVLPSRTSRKLPRLPFATRTRPKGPPPMPKPRQRRPKNALTTDDVGQDVRVEMAEMSKSGDREPMNVDEL